MRITHICRRPKEEINCTKQGVCGGGRLVYPSTCYVLQGFGEDFVDFLDELDDIASRAKGKSSKNLHEDEMSEEDENSDAESMESDTIHYSDDEEDMEDIQSLDEVDGSEEEVEDLGLSSVSDDSDDNGRGITHCDLSRLTLNMLTLADDEIDEASNTIIYRPVAGQDIYGRSKNAEAAKPSGTYVPPAARLRQAGNSNVSNSDRK